jgi:hypothetical protein
MFLKRDRVFLAWLIAKPTACQDDNHERRHSKANDGCQVQSGHIHGEKEWYQNNLWDIDTGMRQESGENTSFCVIENPG